MPFRAVRTAIALGILCFTYLGTINGQIDTEFWFAVPKETEAFGNLTAQNNASFKITAYDETAHVVVEMPSNPAFLKRYITVPPYSSQIVILATDWAQFDAVYANTALGLNVPVTSKTNRGIHIHSDFNISVYYDYDMNDNRDLFSLKGRNGFDTEFFVPFQNTWNNSNATPKYTSSLPYSSILITATDTLATTTVTITPPTIPGAIFPIFQGRPDNNPFTITLNKGETYCLVSRGQAGIDHPTGTKITSDKKIAVINNDDVVVQGGCEDIIGDQLVGTSIIGSQYVVMTGGSSGENIFVLATQDGTKVDFFDKNGTQIGTTLLNASQQYRLPVSGLDPQTSIYINASSKVYVWHVSNLNCQGSAAILPPISNCTGSYEVNFFFSNTINKLFVNLMMPRNADPLMPVNDPNQGVNFFRMKGSDGTDIPLPASWFELNEASQWFVLKPQYRDFTGITKAGVVFTVYNTKDIFHAGYINGHDQKANKYGYFSSFNATTASAVVRTSNEASHISCFGDTIFLKASGGQGFMWHYGTPDGPPTYLSDPTVAIPQVFCPPGFHDFYVIVKQSRCFSNDTFKLSVRIHPEVIASFETDRTSGCAPFRSNFINRSVGGNKYEWSYRKNNDPSIVFFPSSPLNFVQPTVGNFENSTSPYAPVIYTYRLKASYYGECPDTVSKQIIVYPIILANFIPKDTVACSPSLINFTNLSSGNVADSLYNWDFSDGSTSPYKNPSHIFENSFSPVDTTYKVSLVASSPYYCRDTAWADITIHPYIKAGFTVDTVRGCSPLTIKVYNVSQNKGAIDQYVWDFGDGTIRTDHKDTLYHTYPANYSDSTVSYRLRLTIKNKSATGCPDTLSRLITVYPQAYITFTTNPGNNPICDSTEVSFTSLPSPAITSYLWDFGDGNTSSEQNPTHLFVNNTNSDKTYSAKLTGMSDKYCNGYASRDIIVNPFLDPQFSVNVPSFCAPYPAPIINKSRGGIIKYEWTYGDGGKDNHTGDTVHIYRNTTNITFVPLIKLVVTNSGGCKDSLSQRLTVYPEIKARFTPSSAMGCNPLTVNFTNQSTYLNSSPKVSEYIKWEFGDSTSSADINPTHTFTNTTAASATFHVKLTVESRNNCTDDSIVDINVLPYIEAKFSVDSVNGCSPFPAQIINSSRGLITQYQWIYGDGAVDSHSAKFYSHTYLNNSSNNPSNTPLLRYLKLIASNSSGICQSRDSILLTIYPEVQSKFSSDVNEGCNSLKVKFANQSGPGFVPVKYKWEFGDGGTSFEVNPEHIFINYGSSEKTYQPKLYAYSMYQCTDTSSLNIKVYPFIKAGFSINDPFGCSPYNAHFINSSSPGSNSFQWIFGDETQSSTEFSGVDHVYQNTGPGTKNFNPLLIAGYNGLCNDTIQQTVSVYPEVLAAFTEDTLKACHPYTISFTNKSLNATSFNWNFGDNGTSILANPNHYYTNFSNTDSVYLVSLIARSNNCSDTVTKNVIIYPKPKALYEINAPFKSCPPFFVPINNLSEAGDFYNWSFGDGKTFTTTTLEPVSHVYDNHAAVDSIYTLNLAVSSIHNCKSNVSTNILVYPRVIADFTPDTSGCSPLLVSFLNKSVRASSYFWDFGDFNTTWVKSPSNRFYNTSLDDTTYKVTMIASSITGCKDTTTRQVTVHPQPDAEFSVLPAYLYYPDATVVIDNQSNAGHWNYSWNFNDGQSSVEEEPKLHEYMRWGLYDVNLKAWSAYCVDSVSHRVRIFPPKPIADFDMTDNGCVPLTVNFTDHSTWGTFFKWEFDDGGVSTEKNPTHVYQTPGKYMVKQTVFGDGGESFTYRTIEVYPKPKVQFFVSPDRALLPNAEVNTYNTTLLGFKYLWNFGDGDTSNLFEPTHVYKSLGVYDISLTAWTEHQCSDSAIMQNRISVEGTGILNFPNAFRPNENGSNGGKYKYPDIENIVFHPLHAGVVEYKLEIYDRWGELLFESNDVNIGWDGYYKGNLCKSDVYIWKATGRFTNGKRFNKAGDVTLLR